MVSISKNKKIIWLIGSTVVLGVFTNTIIIVAAYIYFPNLFWILLITIPLSIVGIYNAKQINHILDKYRIITLQEAKRQKKYERLSHSIYSNEIEETDLKTVIGNDQCGQPYNACLLNIGTTRNTYPEKAIVRSINDKKFEPFKNSCEETLLTYSLGGGDLVWQIGPTYIGCRNANGSFNSKAFKENACRPEVRMIELMLSNPTRPVYSANSSLDIGDGINPKTNNRIFSGSSYSTFIEAEGMIHFLDSLRQLSGKKPIGLRLRISDKKEFHEICHAIRKTQLIPDFIVVEGSFESYSTIHKNKGIHTAMPLYEALLFVSQTLEVYALEKKIKIIAYGKILSCFDILKLLALGANVVYTEMPRYTTIDGKTFSLYNRANETDFYSTLINATAQAMKICGFKNANDITLSKLFRWMDILLSSGFEPLNSSISYPGAVKKLYVKKIKPYLSPEEKKKVQYR